MRPAYLNHSQPEDPTLLAFILLTLAVVMGVIAGLAELLRR
jgi:hypothetical protein